MLRLAVLSLILIAVVSPRATDAALIERLGGFVYDTDLDITWLAHANLAGNVSWFQAINWAESLEVGGHSDWRLPSIAEMQHLYVDELDGTRPLPIRESSDVDVALFTDIAPAVGGTIDVYWSNEETFEDLNFARAFSFNNFNTSGDWRNEYKGNGYNHAWGVHAGDIGLPVPEPSTALLVGLGLVVVGLKRSRRAA